MGGYSYGSGAWPDFNALLDNFWGAGQEFWCAGYSVWASSGLNFVQGQNPPYYLDNVLAFTPKFFGVPTAYANCAIVQGSATVTCANGTAGLAYGQFLQAPGLAPGSVVTGVTGPMTFTVNLAATGSQPSATAQVYTQPVVPTAVMQIYLNLAWASLVQVRWFDAWPLAMALYIAHYLTLYAETDSQTFATALVSVVHGEAPVGVAGQSNYTLSAAPPGGVLQSLTNNGVFLTPGADADYMLTGQFIALNAPQSGDNLYATWPVQAAVTQAAQLTGAQVAAAGVAQGVLTSKSVGDVSASYTALEFSAQWGAWSLTKYGQQLITMAQVVGAGPSVIY